MDEGKDYLWTHIVSQTLLMTGSTISAGEVCLQWTAISHRKNRYQMRKAGCVEKRVALILWFLATNADYRTIGHLFGVSKPTVITVLLLYRQSTFEYHEGMNLWTWIYAVCRGSWWNPHFNCVSNKMQGMLENVAQFTEVYTGWPGSVHSARVSIRPQLERNQNMWKRGSIIGYRRSCISSPFLVAAYCVLHNMWNPRSFSEECWMSPV